MKKIYILFKTLKERLVFNKLYILSSHKVFHENFELSYYILPFFEKPDQAPSDVAETVVETHPFHLKNNPKGQRQN